MISAEMTKQAKLVAIESYLAYRGYHPVSRSGQRLLYLSPLRGEATPSFWVNQSLNRYKDFGSSEKGDDVICLVQRLDNCSFGQAVLQLQQFVSQAPTSVFSFSGPSSSLQTPAAANTIKSVKLLSNRHLLRYAESRGISSAIARRYCCEVYYTQEGKNLFALGFANEKGGYALRNGVGVKRNVGPACYSLIAGQRNTRVNVFEGLFDFLSALEYYGLQAPNYTTVVLNSTTNLEAALPALKCCSQVNAYLDHDKAGKTAFDKLVNTGLPVVDRSELYQDCKDLNEFWQQYSRCSQLV